MILPETGRLLSYGANIGMRGVDATRSRRRADRHAGVAALPAERLKQSELSVNQM